MGMAPCDFSGPETYSFVQQFQHDFKAQTHNKQRKICVQLMSRERWNFTDNRLMGMVEVW